MKYRITVRTHRDIDWFDKNHILQDKELGASVAYDGSVRYKLGDGIHPWTELPWIETLMSNKEISNER